MTFSQAKFFDVCRSGVMGPTLDQNEVSGAIAILDAMVGAPMSHCAYALATAWLETNHTLKPIREIGGPNYFFRMYDIGGNRPQKARELGNVNAGDGVKYHGRGYVQLTGRTNYATATRKLGIDLIAKPDDAMKPDIAAKIMRVGMTEGWFTGVKFATYLPNQGIAELAKFVQARRIINGVDRADEISKYALQFQSALASGGWQ